MRKLFLGFSFMTLLPSYSVLHAAELNLPLIEAMGETDPIPYGTKDSDDSAIWVSKQDPSRSLILGTSKYDKDPALGGGLGVYDLKGKERQFLGRSKLNNVDVSYGFKFEDGLADIAVASNRSTNSLNLYRIDPLGQVSQAAEAALFDEKGAGLEPYGLCLGSNNPSTGLDVFLPLKSGVIYHYRVNPAQLNKPVWVGSYDLGARLTKKQDSFVKSIVQKEAEAEGELDDLQEDLEERFALEGCVFDPRSQLLYVGMENLGIWTIDTKQETVELLLQIGSSWIDISPASALGSQARFTDDIEGMDILQKGQSTYLVFSNQGIDEYSLFDLQKKKWIGNFKLGFGAKDPVSKTDGLALSTASLGREFSEGILVVHDDQNTDASGQRLNANFKIVSLSKIFEAFAL